MLTKREIEILEYIKIGLKQKVIANKLKLSQPAISKFQRNIKRKYKESLDTLKIIKEKGVKIEI